MEKNAIVSIHKKGDMLTVENYCSISLLQICDKIERLLSAEVLF